MKKIFLCVLLVAAGTACNTPPTATERALFDITTNQVQEVTFVAGTNGEASTWVTNVVEVYDYKPGGGAAAVTRVAEVGGTAAGGFGELAAALCGGAFGLWGYLRGRKANKTAGVLAQIVETGRKVLQETPQGAELDEQFKRWMIKHQNERGVLREVMAILSTAVSPETAAAVAQRIAQKLSVES